MMPKYIPFLKSKVNEIQALKCLDGSVLNKIVPFFDYPKRNGEQDEDEFILTVDKLVKSIRKNLSGVGEFYFDSYDLTDNFLVDGCHNYHYLLGKLSCFNVIPVVSIDRDMSHNAVVQELKETSGIRSNVVAFRITTEHFESYDVVKGEIEEELGDVFSKFEWIDLIFDTRVCSGVDVDAVAENIMDFSDKFNQDFSVRRFVVTGSSIPASVADVLPSGTDVLHERIELNLYRAIRGNLEDNNFIFGDYTTVSPDFSEVGFAPEMLRNITTAKFIYSTDSYHYFIRGRSLKKSGAQQYFDMAETLCSKPFFRGKDYSDGDSYFEERSRGAGNNCQPNTVVKPSVNSHITYMVNDSPI